MTLLKCGGPCASFCEVGCPGTQRMNGSGNVFNIIVTEVVDVNKEKKMWPSAKVVSAPSIVLQVLIATFV